MTLDSIFFLSCFLPLALAACWLIPGIKSKNWMLLGFSLLFYLFGGISSLLLLLAVIFVNYGIGLFLRGNRFRTTALITGIILDLSGLIVYKYLDFLLSQVLGQPQLTFSLTAPLGISFFTFKSISYLVDAYRDPKQAATRLPDLALYLSFFPQISMGPITRFSDFATQLTDRAMTAGQTAQGLQRFVTGLAKKVYLSTALGTLVDSLFALDANILDLRIGWIAAIGYSLQLYMDFSGCMDMAIGLGQVFGFQTAENFNFPYTARTIGGFWRRWHMTLSSWFKDYVYIPLGGSRKGKLRAGINKCIVFLLCGIWHGANWTFLLWGIWHGLFSLLESTGVIPAKRLEQSRILGHIYTLFVVILGFVMFRAGSVQQGFAMLGAMFTGFSFTAAGTVALQSALTGQVLLMGIISVCICLPVRRPLPKVLSRALTLVLFVLCLLHLAAGNFAPAIYAQF